MAGKSRSPNFPQVKLSKAIAMAEGLWEQEQRTSVPPEVVVKAFGFGAFSGPARVAIGALRKYGLLDKTSGGICLSGLALRILHPEGPDEKQDAIRKAALEPELFRELSESHAQASDAALRAHLITKRKFTTGGADLCIESFRDALGLANLKDSGYSKLTSGSEYEVMQTLPAQGTAPAQVLAQAPVEALVFNWPLAKGVMAEVRLTGVEIKPDHLERLRQYLDLAKAAVTSDDE